MLVASLASVHSGVALIDSGQFQDNEPKVGDGLDSRSSAQRFTVVEPFDAQTGISDGNHAALKVSHAVLRKRQIGRSAQELGR